jgi:hypothetical protein
MKKTVLQTTNICNDRRCRGREPDQQAVTTEITKDNWRIQEDSTIFNFNRSFKLNSFFWNDKSEIAKPSDYLVWYIMCGTQCAWSKIIFLLAIIISVHHAAYSFSVSYLQQSKNEVLFLQVGGETWIKGFGII